MKVTIRLRRPPSLRNANTWPRQLGLAVASLLTPASVTAAAMGVWRIGADLRWMGEFAIASGIFSHWQVWFAVAGGLELLALALHRRFGRDQAAS